MFFFIYSYAWVCFSKTLVDAFNLYSVSHRVHRISRQWIRILCLALSPTLFYIYLRCTLAWFDGFLYFISNSHKASTGCVISSPCYCLPFIMLLHANGFFVSCFVSSPFCCLCVFKCGKQIINIFFRSFSKIYLFFVFFVAATTEHWFLQQQQKKERQHPNGNK